MARPTMGIAAAALAESKPVLANCVAPFSKSALFPSFSPYLSRFNIYEGFI